MLMLMLMLMLPASSINAVADIEADDGDAAIADDSFSAATVYCCIC